MNFVVFCRNFEQKDDYLRTEIHKVIVSSI